MVETYNCTDSGSNIWSFSSSLPNADLSTFMVDMARHAVGFGAGAVDTVAAQANFVSPSNCAVYAFSSAGSAVPVWQWNLTNCDSSLLYDMDRFIDISDDGSTVAFSYFVPSGTQSVPMLTVFDGQTGAVRFTKALAAGAGTGPVQLSSQGAWVAWTQGDTVVVYSGTTGAIRDTVPMGWNTPAQLSDDGSFLAFSGDDTAHIYEWSAANSQYALKFALQPPGGGTWYSVSCSLSSDGSGAADAELVAFAFYSEGALSARVVIYSMVTGALMTDWTSTTNAKLQTNPTVRMDGNYAGVCLWGDNGEVPTAVVLAAGVSTPVFTYVTPGSEGARSGGRARARSAGGGGGPAHCATLISRPSPATPSPHLRRHVRR